MAKKTVTSERTFVLKLETFGEYVWLTAPYKASLTDIYKELKGIWQPTSKTWRFVNNVVIVKTLQNLCQNTWGITLEPHLLDVPYPEDKLKRRWSPERDVLKDSSALLVAERVASDLAKQIANFTPEEKEKVLKPIFDVL